MLFFPILAVINALYFMSRLRRLVSDIRTLTSEYDMRRYRHEVRLQMYAALAQIGLLSAPILLLFYGAFSHRLRPLDVLYVIIPSVIVILVGRAMKKTEQAAKNMPASRPELEQERDRVVHVWDARPLPDWSD
jgi:hypothetical protein